MSRASARSWPSVAVLAVRRTDGPGWEIVDTTREGTARDDGLRALGLDPASARQILTYSPGRGSEVPDLAPSEREGILYSVLGRSWAYDEPAGFWRAPDEPVTEPDGPAPRADRIAVDFGRPDVGWLPITLSAAGRTDIFSASSVFDPFEDMIAWLEEIAAGRHPRLSIDIEGEHVGLHVWPAEGDRVRFAVERIDAAPPWTIDVEIERHRLAESIYAPLVAFWEGPDLAAAWAEWLYDSEEREACPQPYPLRSPALDAFIQG